jgi:hypothetical protein
VDRDVAGLLQRRKHVVADEQLARLARPVLAERRLHVRHHRAPHANADVGVVLAVLGVAEPLVLDAVAADERDLAVQDHDLAVVALVKDADVADVATVEHHDPAAGALHLLPDRVAHLLGPDRIEQHAHLQPGLRTLGQGVGDAPGQRALLPEEGLEVHGLRGLADLLDQHLEERAVLEHLDRIAGDRRRQGKAGERGHQLVDRLVALDVQIGIAMPLDRPDDQRQDDDEDEEQRREDRREHRAIVVASALMTTRRC